MSTLAFNKDIQINSHSAHGIRFAENKGVWWPLAMAVDKFGPQNKKDYVTRGSRVGVIKSSEFGNPVGTARVEEYEDNNVTKTEGHGCKNMELQEGDFEDTWKTLNSAVSSAAKTTKREREREDS